MEVPAVEKEHANASASAAPTTESSEKSQKTVSFEETDEDTISDINVSQLRISRQGKEIHRPMTEKWEKNLILSRRVLEDGF